MNSSMNIIPPGIIKPENKIEIHRAKWILIDPWHIIKNGYVEFENQIIKQVENNNPCLRNINKSCIIDHGSGVLMPPLINAHTHLELSCFRGMLDVNCKFENKFEAWVRKLIDLREKTDEKIIKESAQKAVYDLLNFCVLYIGEISSSGITKDIMDKSFISGVFFREFLGTEFNKDRLNLIKKSNTRANGKIHCSYAGHAPHTTSPDLLKALKQITNSKNIIFSIHAGESFTEQEFITKGKGKWADFLKERGIDYSLWDLPQKSPIQHLFNHGLLDPLTLLVHVLNANEDDFEIIIKSGAKMCICARSNMYLHGQLPDLEKMLDMGIEPAIGTDSLASCDSLSIFDEMRYIRKNYKNVLALEIIAMASLYGAKALGMEKYTGTLEKGKKAEMIYIPLKAENESDLLEQIIEYEF